MERQPPGRPAPALPVLATPRLVLRLARREDAPAVLEYYRAEQAYLEPWMPTPPPGFHTLRFWVLRAEENLRELWDGSAVRLFAFDAASTAPRVLGAVNLTHVIRGPLQACFLGYSLGARQAGQGLMTEALAAALDYAFAEVPSGLGLHRVQANYMPHNRASAAILKKLGFAVEGVARDYLQIAGQWEDHVLAAITAPAWRARQGA